MRLPRSHFIPAATLALVLSSCSSPYAVRRALMGQDGPRPRALSAKASVPPPGWTEHPPRGGGVRFFVGESRGSIYKEEALEKAWVSALVQAGMTEFPELSQVTSESVEGLRDVRHERRFLMRLERVNWNGLREATEYGSPYLDLDARTGEYTVYRLLKWGERDIDMAKREIAKNHVHTLPIPPELVHREQKRMAEALSTIASINARNAYHNALVEKVMHEVKCGVTVADLMKVLGEPDRYNPYNSHILDKQYYWGQYLVERRGDNPVVATITKEDGRSKPRVVCRGALSSDEMAFYQ